MKKIPVGVLGATGMVGQQYIRLLADHPWFEVAYVAASERSAGKTYGEATVGRWYMDSETPPSVASLMVHDVANIAAARAGCSLVFSAFELPDKQAVRDLEEQYARAELPVISNTSAHRSTSDVPLLIPEINASHCAVIAAQRVRLGTRVGFIAVKPNCSLQSYLLPLHALIQAGFSVDRVLVSTLQAVSGAGYPGVASLDIIDNIVPYISGEEEKTEQEPLKILGSIEQGQCVPAHGPRISAHCNRVPVVDGHVACVSFSVQGKKPDLAQIRAVWEQFSAEPQVHRLPSAPAQAIIYREEPNRPQPRKDRHHDMAVVVGRLRACPVFDFKYVGLSHNTVRGAAGGGILNAELLVHQGYIAR